MDPIFRLKRFSQLPDAGILTGDEIIPVSRPDQDYRTTFAEFLSYIDRAGASGGQYTVDVLTTSGTWQCPENFTGTLVHLRMCGGGAGGPPTSGANRLVPGANAGYVEGWYEVQAGQSYPYVVGAGGSAALVGDPLGPSSPGGNSEMFGAVAEGGPASTGSDNPVIGGYGSGAVIIKTSFHRGTTSSGMVVGDTPFGTPTVSNLDVDSTGYGVGGMSATQTQDGTAGKPGLIILEYFVTPDPEEP